MMDVPTIPGYMVYLNACKHERWEGKYSCVLDPRTTDGKKEKKWHGSKGIEPRKVEAQAVRAWRESVQRHVAGLLLQDARSNPSSRYDYDKLGWDWIDALKVQSARVWDRFETLEQLHARSLHTLEARDVVQEHPAKVEFAEVLRLLRLADESGKWPASSVGRQKVIHGGGGGQNKNQEGSEKWNKFYSNTSHQPKQESSWKWNHVHASATAESTAPAASPQPEPTSQSSSGGDGGGGTFSVGILPGDKHKCKGNELFPELLEACFRLERKLAPHRPPSATIAVNRHAQFKPHRDSGAGSGQSTSLIVALGDFVGGEIVVENVAKDIRCVLLALLLLPFPFAFRPPYPRPLFSRSSCLHLSCMIQILNSHVSWALFTCLGSNCQTALPLFLYVPSPFLSLSPPPPSLPLLPLNCPVPYHPSPSHAMPANVVTRRLSLTHTQLHARPFFWKV
jgi:hypothetical protein